MVHKYENLYEEVARERQFKDEKTKKTKYAVPSYQYVEAHSKVDGLWLFICLDYHSGTPKTYPNILFV